MQVIEKVKVVPEGYNGAGGRMLGDGSTNINVLGAPTAFQAWGSFFYLSKF